MDASGADERDDRPKYVAPHRGAAVLTLGILGLCVCLVCGIIAWVMGNTDLRAMREGRMDRSGEGMTNAGRICGMVSVALHVVGIVIWVVIAVVVVSHGHVRVETH